MFETEDKYINGISYRVTKLPAMKAFRLLGDLAKMLGPSFGEIVDGGAGATNLGDAEKAISSSGAVSKAMALLFENLHMPKTENILKELAAVTMFDPEGGENHRHLKPAFDTHFSGDMGGLILWAKFALEVQYGNLPSALSELGFGSPAESIKAG